MDTNAEENSQKNDWAKTVRDIGIKAIDSGQFLLFCVFIVVIIFLMKLPSDALGDIAKGFFVNIKEYATSGYVLFVLTLLGAGFYVNAISKRHTQQLTQRDNIIRELKMGIPLLEDSTAGEGK